MQQGSGSALLSLMPLILMSIPIGITARKLAKEKGRNVTLWTVLGFIPLVNYFCIMFFIGAANLRVERKLDELHALLNTRANPGYRNDA